MDHDFSKPVENLEAVPAQFHALYTEQDGQYVLKSDETTKGAVEAIVGLNKALKASRAEAKAAKGIKVDLTPLKEFGETPEDIANTIKSKMEELTTNGSADVKRQIEKIKADLAQGHSTDLKNKDERINALTKQLYGHLVDSEATSAVAAAKGVPELLLPFVRNQVKVVEQDGKMNVHVVDAAGDVRYSGTTGQPMSIRELVDEMKGNKTYGRLFESDTSTGGGTKPGQSTARHQQQTRELSATEKISAGLKKNQQQKT